ncbi:TetR/AcrR family transcriptional repressor of qacA [Geomicrobium halophilum]|uniref:TetR/AcrR family transcriptional repressor of qacA n=1 Tax=Geomicrobium halophilum TaxID=549000 RepID=A0A841Q2Q9_9BACL|nr:TetR/AcrR family transcriptional regulator [Geomicrobium halophilum]MBB6451168.1 TetR/AcrR family transcriptional repressor of qacA [Geomicrobium halophilum]
MKDKIMTAAREIFIRKGFTATSIGDIVKASESSKGNLYHHFTNKEELFLTIIEEDENEWDTLWAQHKNDDESASEMLHTFADFSAYVDADYPLRHAVNEFLAKEHESQSISQKIDQMNDNYIQHFQDILKKGNEENEWVIKDIQSISKAAASMYSGLELHTLGHSLEERRYLYHQATSIFLYGIKNEPSHNR